MTTEMWIIAVVRLAAALPVLRWPFYGGVFAVLVDQSDLFMMNLIDLGGVRNYQTFDKWLDQAYLLAFLAVAVRDWRGVERNVAVVLYAYRFVGFLAFEVSRSRGLLLFFPNLFEFWFLFVAGRRQFGLQDVLKGWRFGVILVALAGLKLFQEFAIHDQRWLDSFTAVEAVEAIWDWVVPI